jgi:hypothetical protein
LLVDQLPRLVNNLPTLVLKPRNFLTLPFTKDIHLLKYRFILPHLEVIVIVEILEELFLMQNEAFALGQRKHVGCPLLVNFEGIFPDQNWSLTCTHKKIEDLYLHFTFNDYDQVLCSITFLE